MLYHMLPRPLLLSIGLVMTVVEGTSIRHRKSGRCHHSPKLIHAASMLDHTNRHLSYAVTRTSDPNVAF
jgi:hypothetical protein